MGNPEQTSFGRLGVHRIRIPNTFSNNETNCYFINDSLPTLIDTGIATEAAYGALADGLLRLGCAVRDIKRIVLTHGHADHRALAPRIQAESGAELLYHQAERTKVMAAERPHSLREAGIEFFRLMGVPGELIGGLVDGPDTPSIKPKSTCATALAGGEEILFDAVKLQAIHTPGHSSGSMCLLEKEHGFLFTGDTLLPTSRVTALMELDLLTDTPHYNPLKLHMESLRRLEALQPSSILPGHGEPFSDHARVNNEVRERHRKRRAHILRALRHEPKTLYQICRSVFLFNSPDDLYLALSEVLGNLGILLDEGAVKKGQEEPFFLYAKA
jgi:glyoxylase-like metal-dependent hydrolase (beta-lactamase superfamily II)